MMDDFRPQRPGQPTDKPDGMQPAYNEQPETYEALPSAQSNPEPTESSPQKPKKKSGAKKALLWGVVVLLLAGAGALAYWQWSEAENAKKELEAAKQQLSALSATKKTEEKDASNEQAPEGFTVFKDDKLSFVYPSKWGSATAAMKARNREDFEPKKTYIVSFSDVSTRLLVSPQDWQFTGGDSDWNFPALHQRTLAAYKTEMLKGSTTTSLLSTETSVGYIYYTALDAQIHVEALLMGEFGALNASYVELQDEYARGTLPTSCETKADAKCLKNFTVAELQTLLGSIK